MTDQHAHLHVLESTFVVSCLLHRKFSGFPIICFLEIGAFAVVLYDSLCLAWSQAPKTDIVVRRGSLNVQTIKHVLCNDYIFHFYKVHVYNTVYYKFTTFSVLLFLIYYS